MPSNLYTGSGKTITLDKKIGEGGEGYVCTIKGNSTDVAKIYHVTHLPDADKQDKLIYMVNNSSPELLSYLAWATDTLHKRRNGRIIGFLMPKVADCHPIYTLYNPSHRKQAYPNLTWHFLLHAARNIAAAFKAIHVQGHVIGDVNQGNLLFAMNSQVTLIDADSFQITTADKTHLCPVGVAHFTPPELQGNSNFDSKARTANHDNFGLALLIFHLLMGGRHPFAGVPLIDDAGNLLEHDIRNYRYVYADDNQRRGIKPPPTGLPIELLPENIQRMLTRAFTEIGKTKRPTANEWLNALESLCKQVTRCGKNTKHVFSAHLAECPWCQFEDKGLFYFGVDKGITAQQKQKRHNKSQPHLLYGGLIQQIKQYETTINGLKNYSLKTMPTPESFAVTARSLTRGYLTTSFYQVVGYIFTRLKPTDTDNSSIKVAKYSGLIIFGLGVLATTMAGMLTIALSVAMLPFLSLLAFVYFMRLPIFATSLSNPFITLCVFLLCFLPNILLFFKYKKVRKANTAAEEELNKSYNRAKTNHNLLLSNCNRYNKLVEQHQNQLVPLMDILVQCKNLQKNIEITKAYQHSSDPRARKKISRLKSLVKELERALTTVQTNINNIERVQQTLNDSSNIVQTYAQAEADYNLMKQGF